MGVTLNGAKVLTDTGARVGIGTPVPDSLLDIVGTNPVLRIADSKTNATNKDATFGCQHYTNAEEPVGIVHVLARTGDSFCDIGGGHVSLNAATSVRFYTGGNVTTTTGTARGQIHSDGHWSIGTTLHAAQLTIDQASSSGAVPTLLLDQADVSEEMIEFVSSIGTGNALEAVGAKTLTTTHFIKVTIPGSLTRYIPCGTIA